MGTGRRLAVLLLFLGLIGLPAAVLRVGCVGASCRSTAVAAAPAPFCSLPTDLRALVSAGTYEGRSPDVLAVAGSTPVVSDVGGGVEVPWPSEQGARRSAMAVPLAFIGRGISRGPLPPGLTLDRIAPTLARLLGLHRANPDVRSGTEIPEVARPGATSALAVLITWKVIGDPDLSAPSTLPRTPGVGRAVGSATPGSLPLDPIAVEATIGTGGLPSQHGITGTKIRNNRPGDPANGRVVAAFVPSSPQPIIATLGDDLDHATDGRARIGLIASAPGDVALTGDAWYDEGSILDRRVHVHPDIASDVAPFLAEGWGADAVPDLLAIALSGSAANDERATSVIVAQVLRAVPDATLVIAGTGSLDVTDPVTATAPTGTDTIAAGGTFLDRGTGGVTAQSVVDALRAQTSPDGSPLYLDTFASYAVRFGRYC
jgi:hypothetical protein